MDEAVPGFALESANEEVGGAGLKLDNNELVDEGFRRRLNLQNDVAAEKVVLSER